jgi:glucose-1-phosphate thymidylyltransferase
VFPQETLPSFDTYLANDNNPDEPGWFVQWLQQRQGVDAFTFDGAWYDIGTADSYLDAVGYALDGETLVDDDATVTDSQFGENVHVMAGATVENATLSNTVVFPDATVRDATLSRSVVDTEASAVGVELSDSLLGQHTEVDGDGDD